MGYTHLGVVAAVATFAVLAACAVVVGLLAVTMVQPWALLVAVPLAAAVIGGLFALVTWVADL